MAVYTRARAGSQEDKIKKLQQPVVATGNNTDNEKNATPA